MKTNDDMEEKEVDCIDIEVASTAKKKKKSSLKAREIWREGGRKKETPPQIQEAI